MGVNYFYIIFYFTILLLLQQLIKNQILKEFPAKLGDYEYLHKRECGRYNVPPHIVYTLASILLLLLFHFFDV